MPAMTAKLFDAILNELGLTSNAGAGAALDSDERTARRWRQGERAIPGPVAVLLRTWLRIHRSRTLSDEQKADLLPARLEASTP